MLKTIKNQLLLSLFALVILIAMFVSIPFAQNQQAKDKLIDKKKKIEEEIQYYKKLIDETKKNQKLSLNQVVLLKNQINKREQLISTINSDLGVLDSKINHNMQIVKKSGEQLNMLKEEYAEIIYNSYKNRNKAMRLMFIFSSENLNQAHRRMKYFQQYNDYLRQQVEDISYTTNKILLANKELVNQKNEKNQLLVLSEEEKLKLAKEKEKKDADVKNLKKKEKDLAAKLKQKQSEAALLKSKIEAAISSEIKKSAGKTNKTVTTATTVKNVLTPEEKIVSDNFSGNKGKLPWPVERGAITGTFGEHPHPVLDGIKVKNNGIDIATTTGSYARAVLNGVVSSVVTIANNNKAVIIRHGEFFTVYSNLQTILVKKDQKVTTKQNIGIVNTSADDNKTELHFEVWQGRLICNPSDWLSGK